MALILNIETSTAICSVALALNGQLIAFRETSNSNSHSLMLGSFIEDTLSESGFNSKDLAAVAVSEGPGSYTGLRIGVSLAKGLCYSLDIPLIAVPTLLAFANAAKEIDEEYSFIIPMIDARRLDVYTSIFDKSFEELERVKAITIDQNSFSNLLLKSKVLFFGDGSVKCKGVINSENAIFKDMLPSARYMIPLAESFFNENIFTNLAYFEPLYLKEFEAKISLVKGLENNRK
ncbi:MAG: tRNA (adenosine(37)-N6)-threonylcarbamoyltransferase complex dimerization subunit type 1 TsaB [Bacteroidetes bacterium CG2_30_33_31]|nr:MAG: tRNA (adenosine(37)-N6)-threonylcarbamoyltransferase complex dimerization subunit type 1 TsaB [Bacteroidetes bacterium CG2_30_33_31]